MSEAPCRRRGHPREGARGAGTGVRTRIHRGRAIQPPAKREKTHLGPASCQQPQIATLRVGASSAPGTVHAISDGAELSARSGWVRVRTSVRRLEGAGGRQALTGAPRSPSPLPLGSRPSTRLGGASRGERCRPAGGRAEPHTQNAVLKSPWFKTRLLADPGIPRVWYRVRLRAE